MSVFECSALVAVLSDVIIGADFDTSSVRAGGGNGSSSTSSSSGGGGGDPGRGGNLSDKFCSASLVVG